MGCAHGVCQGARHVFCSNCADHTRYLAGGQTGEPPCPRTLHQTRAELYKVFCIGTAMVGALRGCAKEIGKTVCCEQNKLHIIVPPPGGDVCTQATHGQKDGICHIGLNLVNTAGGKGASFFGYNTNDGCYRGEPWCPPTLRQNGQPSSSKRKHARKGERKAGLDGGVRR